MKKDKEIVIQLVVTPAAYSEDLTVLYRKHVLALTNWGRIFEETTIPGEWQPYKGPDL